MPPHPPHLSSSSQHTAYFRSLNASESRNSCSSSRPYIAAFTREVSRPSSGGASLLPLVHFDLFGITMKCEFFSVLSFRCVRKEFARQERTSQRAHWNSRVLAPVCMNGVNGGVETTREVHPLDTCD